MNYGNTLFKLREEKKLTQIEIANILNIDHSQYSHYELEDRTMPIKHLNTLANFFKVSIDYLFNLTTTPNYSNSKNNINLKLQKQRLKEFRKENNLTQKDLADFLNADNSTISKYERERQPISTTFIYSICKKYNISADYLLGKTDKPKKLQEE